MHVSHNQNPEHWRVPATNVCGYPLFYPVKHTSLPFAEMNMCSIPRRRFFFFFLTRDLPPLSICQVIFLSWLKTILKPLDPRGPFSVAPWG